MPERFRHRILGHLADRRYEPRQIRQLAHDLGIDTGELDDFERAAGQLIAEGQIVRGSADAVALPPMGPQMIGTFRLARGGFGFVIGESATDHGDLFIPASSTIGALTGDHVRAKVVHRPSTRAGQGPRYVGRIVEILQRADRHYVGNLSKRGFQWLVRLDGRLLHDPVVVRDPHAKHATEGDKVVVELLRYPTEKAAAEGVITEVLGKHGQPDVETLAVMRLHGLIDAFDPAVLTEAREAAARFDPQAVPASRLDLRREHTLTIDPPDAQDFDDAIGLKRIDNDPDGAAYELAVHIADVSYFVARDGALDREAAKRGNSAYLPKKVVPMLPELLSNGVCSLQQDVDRFCKSAFIGYDENGRVLSQRFARTVIRSDHRLTYREAAALTEGDTRAAKAHTRSDAKYPRHLIEQLKLMDELARVLQRRRFGAGMISLDLPEVELLYDDSGRVVDAQPEDDAFTHTLVEMFMVEANEAAARLFDGLNVPMIRRVHPEPPTFDMKQLRQFARVAGYNIPAQPTRKELQTLLDSVRGKPAQHAVHLAVLKTLSRAEYSLMTIGHFALAAEHYTHFTSPIRRYPDLVVHRGLDAYLDLTDNGRARQPSRRKLSTALREAPILCDTQGLDQTASHCSTTERNAEAAERELRNYLVLELLSAKLGEDFDGTVTGLTGSGVFVQIDRYLIDGFIPTAELPAAGARGSERWRLNRVTGALVAQRSGKTISIGDRFVVRIASVDAPARSMDLVIVDPKAKTARDHRRQPPGPAASHQKPMRLKQVRQRDRRRR